MREEKTFRVVVFRFETYASTNYTRYMITKNYMPFFPGVIADGLCRPIAGVI